jgi:hypothetical protein
MAVSFKVIIYIYIYVYRFEIGLQHNIRKQSLLIYTYHVEFLEKILIVGEESVHP